mmetsp:Transcript_4349/g.9629  ORF Transcript_4349/g.9629 Transcript_4349/m.9629 type:complete len:278 (+) Transcript_4349:752-1585(+)
MIGHGLGEEGFSRTRNAVEDDALGGFNANVLVQFGMRQWQFHRLLDFLNLILETSNVSVTLQRGLLHLHDADHGIGIVFQNSHDTHGLIVQQHRAPRLQQILIHRRQNIDIIFRSHARAHNGVIIINQLLQRPHSHGTSAQFLELLPFFLIPLLARLEHLVIANEFLLHEQKILNAFQFHHAQFAFGCGNDRGDALYARGTGAALPALAGGAGTGLESLLLLFVWVVFAVALVVVVAARGTALASHSWWYVSHDLYCCLVLVSSCASRVWIPVLFLE